MTKLDNAIQTLQAIQAHCEVIFIEDFIQDYSHKLDLSHLSRNDFTIERRYAYDSYWYVHVWFTNTAYYLNLSEYSSDAPEYVKRWLNADHNIEELRLHIKTVDEVVIERLTND